MVQGIVLRRRKQWDTAERLSLIQGTCCCYVTARRGTYHVQREDIIHLSLLSLILPITVNKSSQLTVQL